jgi:hypothetical protein
MKKVSELAGAELNQWVARALGLRVEMRKHSLVTVPVMVLVEGGGSFIRGVPQYSADWAQGGPIIELERIDLAAPCETGSFSQFWTANTEWGHPDGYQGETALIAAMRAFVASKFGTEVATKET